VFSFNCTPGVDRSQTRSRAIVRARIDLGSRIARAAETGEASHRVIQHGLTDGIEEITGRRAIGLVSTNNIDPDRGVEVFIVDPTDTNGHVGDGASGG
jgi:hypothetical protein